MQTDMIDVRDERGHLLFRISRDRSIIQIKQGRSRDQLYEVDLSANRPIARRAAVHAPRSIIVCDYEFIGIDNNSGGGKL